MDISLSQASSPGIEGPWTGTEAEYRDGFNLFVYARLNPGLFTDPFGLSVWDEDIDEAIDDWKAHRVAATAYLHKGSAIALVSADVAQEIIAELLGINDLLYSLRAQGIGRRVGVDGLIQAGIGRLSVNLGAKIAKWQAMFKQLSRIGGAVKYVRHHLVPKQILRRYLPEDVAKHPRVRGTRGFRNVWHIPQDLHRLIHGKAPGGGMYNQFWIDEIRRLERAGKEITVDRVLRIRDRAIRLFELDKFRTFKP